VAKHEYIDIPVGVAIEAEANSGPPKFRSTAYTGGKVQVKGYSLPIIVDLAGLDYAKSVVANAYHDKTADGLVGHVTEKINDGKTLILSGLVSGTGKAAKEVLGNSANQFPWQMSIEAHPTAEPTFIKAGQTVKVNGQTFEGPVLVATKSTLYGVAFVPHGADENTSVSIAAAAVEPLAEIPMKIQEFIEAMQLDPATLTEKQLAAVEAQFKKFEAAEAAAGKPIEAAVTFDLGEIVAAHESYKADVECALADFEDRVSDRKKFTAIKAGAFTAAQELKSKAISEKWASTKYEVAAIKASSDLKIKLIEAASPVGPAIHSGTREVSNEVIEAALCIQRKLPGLEKQFSEQTLSTADRHFRGLGLQRVLIMAAAANGYHLGPGERIGDGNIREVLRHALPPIQASANSTLSLPGVFSNLANKELLAGFNLGPQYNVWREIAKIKSVNDFKAVTSYRLLDNMEYEELAPDGKIKHGTVSEETYQRQAKLYAKMFALTMVDIRNDDLGAFDDLRIRLGGGAAQKLTRLIWTTFLNNAAHFTTARANYIEGATTTLLSDGVGLQLGINAFKAMKSPDGKRVGGSASILLHPPELNSAAVKLYTPVAATKASEVNIYANRYRPVEVDWLSDSSIPNSSATAWYLLQDPAMLASVVVSFLDGNESPTIQSADADFDQLGVQFRGYHAFGVSLAEWMAGVKSKGAT
jgi:hypothetical protein